jgi:hypothetical protein
MKAISDCQCIIPSSFYHDIILRRAISFRYGTVRPQKRDFQCRLEGGFGELQRCSGQSGEEKTIGCISLYESVLECSN